MCVNGERLTQHQETTVSFSRSGLTFIRVMIARRSIMLSYHSKIQGVGGRDGQMANHITLPTNSLIGCL
jgi:hypothetical protein